MQLDFAMLPRSGWIMGALAQNGVQSREGALVDSICRQHWQTARCSAVPTANDSMKLRYGNPMSCA